MENISTLISIIKHLALTLKDPTLNSSVALSTEDRTKKRDEVCITLLKFADLITSYINLTQEINELCELYENSIAGENNETK